MCDRWKISVIVQTEHEVTFRGKTSGHIKDKSELKISAQSEAAGLDFMDIIHDPDQIWRNMTGRFSGVPEICRTLANG